MEDFPKLAMNYSALWTGCLTSPRNYLAFDSRPSIPKKEEKGHQGPERPQSQKGHQYPAQTHGSLATYDSVPQDFLGEIGPSTGSFHLACPVPFPGGIETWFLGRCFAWDPKPPYCHTLKEERSTVWKCCSASPKEISCTGWSELAWLPVVRRKAPWD